MLSSPYHYCLSKSSVKVVLLVLSMLSLNISIQKIEIMKKCGFHEYDCMSKSSVKVVLLVLSMLSLNISIQKIEIMKKCGFHEYDCNALGMLDSER